VVINHRGGQEGLCQFVYSTMRSYFTRPYIRCNNTCKKCLYDSQSYASEKILGGCRKG
jgi:hypothetical protein